MDGIGYVNKEFYLREFQASFVKRWKFSVFACLLTWVAVSIFTVKLSGRASENAMLLINVFLIVGSVISGYIFLDAISTYQLKSSLYVKHFQEKINFNNMNRTSKLLISTYFQDGYVIRGSMVFNHIVFIFIASVAICFYYGS